MRKKTLFLVMVIALFFSAAQSGAVGPWYYVVTGPGGSNEIPIDQIGQVLYFELDATEPDYVWGNVRVDFDPAMLECVSIEETPWVYGFWTAWTTAPGDPAYGGGGILYYYDDSGNNTPWAQQWVAWYGEGVAGPVAAYNNTEGIIRFYTFTNAGGRNGAEPLRIGFRVKQAGTAVFTTSANDWTAFGWLASSMAYSNGVQSQQAAQTGEGYSWRLEDLPYRTVTEVKITTQDVPVVFDLKPGSCRNVVNARSKGVLPAAVVGTADFDPGMIDVASVRVEGVAPLRSTFDDAATPECASSGGDGIADLVLKFDTGEIMHAVEQRLGRPLFDGEEVALALTGSLLPEYGAAPIRGEDVIVTLIK